MPDAIQKILFGSPGTGKSYKVREIAKDVLNIKKYSDSKLLENTVKTVFHPEYTYGDFMGKLLPSTVGNNVIYKFYPGHFLKVLGFAYKSLIEGTREHCLLVIDELNRGNASAIFGTVFQLLDREDDGWSSYEIDISEMELYALLRCIFGDRVKIDESVIHMKNDDGGSTPYHKYWEKKLDECDKSIQSYREPEEDPRLEESNSLTLKAECEEWKCINSVATLLSQNKIKIPPNLSIIATINTSDESIYYLDSAFKRRWDWEYVEAPNLKNKHKISKEVIDINVYISIPATDRGDVEYTIKWVDCVIGINELIKSHLKSTRIEDKQIGLWFIKPEKGTKKIPVEWVRDKLMFYLWDSVFSRNKRPLEEIISKAIAFINDDHVLMSYIPDDSNPIFLTYADFLIYTNILLQYAKYISTPD